MDSSLKNPNYGHWLPPSTPFPPPPPPPPPISHQFHFERFNFYDRSTQSDYHHHLNYHNYTHRLDFPPPPSYYSQPQPQPPALHESPWISHPSCNFSRDFPQSDWVGYMDRTYQLDYGNRTRDCSIGVFTRDLDSYSRSMGGFRGLGYAREDFGESYNRYGARLNCEHTNTNYTNNGGSRENDRSRRRSAHFKEKRFNSFRGKGHSDCGSVKKQTLDQKETSSTAGKVILSKVTSEGGIPFADKSMSSLQSQPWEDKIPNKDMDDLSPKNLQMEEVNDNSFDVEKNTIIRVDSLDPTVVSQAESKHFSQSQDCENGVNSLVETVSRKESMETTLLGSTAEVDHNVDSDAGKYPCITSMSSSPKNVAGKGSSNVQPGERTSVLLCSIRKNKEGGSNLSVFNMELSSGVFLEDVSFVPNQDLGLSSHGPAEIPSGDQSCTLGCRVLKACSSDPNVSLSKDTNASASEFHLNQEVRVTAPTCDSSPAVEIGNMGSSGSKTVTDSEYVPLETQPLTAGCKLLPNDHLGCGVSNAVGSFWMPSVDKDMVDDPLRISSCLVPDSSVSLCHLSPSISVNEELPNSASLVEANCSSQCDIIEDERRRSEYMDVDIQEEKVKLTGETLQCRISGTDFVTVVGDSTFLCGSSSSFPGLLTGKIHNETQAVAKVDKTNNGEEQNKEEILLDASQEKSITFYETVQSGSSLGHVLGSGQTSPGTDAKSCELSMDECGDGVLVENPDGKPTEKVTDVPYDLGSQEISLNIANTDVDVGEALSVGGKVSGTESPSNSDVLLSKLHLHAEDKCAVAPVKDYVVALPPPDSKSKTNLSSISEKTEKRANKFMHIAQKRYPRSLYEIQMDANPPITVKNHHTCDQKSNTPASPMVSVKPKVIVQSDGSYVRKGNSLLRKPSSGSLGEAQNLQRHSSPPSDSSSAVKCAYYSGVDPRANGLPGSSPGEADDQDIVRNGFKSSYASDCQPKQNPPKWESLNPSKLLYVKRKANQLIAASDIHDASKTKIPPSGFYFKRSKNQLVRNSKILANQAKSLSDEASNSQTAAKMVSERSSSSALSEFGPPSRKASRVYRRPQKIIPQPVPWKRENYWRRSMNPASFLPNSSFSIASRKLQMVRKRHIVYARSTSGYSLKKSKVLSIGGSHLKWSKSIERCSKKPEFLSNVESSCSGPSKSMKYTKISAYPKRSAWTRNHNQLVRDPKKQTRVLANERVRWSLNNVRLRLAKRMKYCQFFTRFGKCNKDDGKCPYIHDPSKIAVCTKFLSGLCTNPDCKLTHKVVSESMPDCYYFLQGLCNNEPCPYRHVHVHQNAVICEGFLRGYCSDANECQKKHTYTCPVFKATGSCPQLSECKLHHPKNLSKGKKRKRASEPWQKNASGRYFGSLHKHLPESEPMLVKELAVDGEFFGGEPPDFIKLDVNEHDASENMDLNTRESVSDDSGAHDWIDELIRPVGLMQEEVPVTPSEKVSVLE